MIYVTTTNFRSNKHIDGLVDFNCFGVFLSSCWDWYTMPIQFWKPGWKCHCGTRTVFCGSAACLLNLMVLCRLSQCELIKKKWEVDTELIIRRLLCLVYRNTVPYDQVFVASNVRLLPPRSLGCSMMACPKGDWIFHNPNNWSSYKSFKMVNSDFV